MSERGAWKWALLVAGVVVFAAWSWQTRYVPLQGSGAGVVWDRWAHRACVAGIGDLVCRPHDPFLDAAKATQPHGPDDPFLEAAKAQARVHAQEQAQQTKTAKP